MSRVYGKMIRKSDDTLKNLKCYLEHQFENDGIVHLENVNGIEILLAVYEKYYLRTNSMASLSIQCISHNGQQTLFLVGTGGGEGLLGLSLGANEDYAETAVRILSRIGFKEVDVDD